MHLMDAEVVSLPQDLGSAFADVLRLCALTTMSKLHIGYGTVRVSAGWSESCSIRAPRDRTPTLIRLPHALFFQFQYATDREQAFRAKAREFR